MMLQLLHCNLTYVLRKAQNKLVRNQFLYWTILVAFWLWYYDWPVWFVHYWTMSYNLPKRKRFRASSLKRRRLLCSLHVTRPLHFPSHRGERVTTKTTQDQRGNRKASGRMKPSWGMKQDHAELAAAIQKAWLKPTLEAGIPPLGILKKEKNLFVWIFNFYSVLSINLNF